MSTATVLPPNSSSVARRLPRLTVRARQLLTTVNLHYAGVAALVVLDIYLILHLLVVWQSLSSTGADAMQQQRTMLAAAQIANRPLEGIDQKLAQSTVQADAFYADRLPYAYSQVAAELGTLARREGVRLTTVKYAQAPALAGRYALTEVRMDASISGEYRSVVRVINALERDHLFFVISGITLTGQQTGQVNLRLRLSTFLRPANEHEAALGVTEALPETAVAGGEATP